MGVVFGPEGEMVLAEEVFVIEEEFFEAGAGDRLVSAVGNASKRIFNVTTGAQKGVARS